MLLQLAVLEDGREQPVLVSLRGDQELNEVKLINALSQSLDQAVLDCRNLTAEDLSRQGLAPLPFGFIGPDLDDDRLKGAQSWTTTFLRFTDPTAEGLTRFICGANQNDHHRGPCSWDELTTDASR